MLDQHHEARDHGSGDGKGRWDLVVAQEEEERANMRDPHGSGMREKRRHCGMRKPKGDNIIRQVCQGHSG
jgi:hypothetical protein